MSVRNVIRSADKLPYVKVDKKWWAIFKARDKQRRAVVEAARDVHQGVLTVASAAEWKLMERLGATLAALDGKVDSSDG